MENNENFVKVTIYGQEYTIKAPADASYIKNIAEFVDERMREVQEELSNGLKLVEVNIKEAIFQKGEDNFVSLNFKNQIREINEF